ncbi:MAG: hypothetical protein Q9214_004826, partial [Letrouitia sp. 1 TL-2023]
KTPPGGLTANKGATTTTTQQRKPLQPGVKKPKKLAAGAGAGNHKKPLRVQGENPKVINPQTPSSLPKQPQTRTPTTRAPQAKLSTTAPAKKKLGAKPVLKPRPLKQPAAAALPSASASASGLRNERATMGRGPADKKLETTPDAAARGKGVRAPPRKLEVRSQ